MEKAEIQGADFLKNLEAIRYSCNNRGDRMEAQIENQVGQGQALVEELLANIEAFRDVNDAYRITLLLSMDGARLRYEDLIA